MVDQVQHSPIGVRFAEAIDYLKGKLPEASLDWKSLAGPVHGKVFTVAGSTSADLSREIQQSLVKGLANGTTITQFRKDFDATVQKHGWTYKGKRGWRTRVIFDANMRAAHMAGRWAQVQAIKATGSKMFGQYRHTPSNHPRRLHMEWNGLIYEADNPFWDTHFTPNGYGCKCTVRWYTETDFKARGLQESAPFKLKTRNVTDIYGDTYDQVPLGVDPGWDHNVGKAWIDPELALGRKLARLPRELQGLLVDKTITPAFQKAITARWKQVQTAVEGGATAAADAQILGFLDSAVLDALATAVPELQLQSTAIVARPGDAIKGWPQGWVDNLPADLRNYRAVLWDQADQVLVVVPQGKLPGDPAGKVPRIVLRPDAASSFGQVLQIDSLGSTMPGDLANRSRYKILSGALR